MVKSQNPVESVSKAAEDCRTPKAGAYSERPPEIQEASEHGPLACAPSGILLPCVAHSQRLEIREASSSAAVFCRFAYPRLKIRESVLECAGPFGVL